MAEIRVKETGTIKLFESDNTSSVTIASPASLGADRTITLPDASVTLASGTMLATDGSGASLTALNASELGSGTVPTARLGSGTASSSTVLYGDQTYKAAAGIDCDADSWQYKLGSPTDYSSAAVIDFDGQQKLGSNVTESAGTITVGTAGWYFIQCHLSNQSTSTDTTDCHCRKNGTIVGNRLYWTSISEYDGKSLSLIVEAAASDTFDIYGVGDLHGDIGNNSMSYWLGYRLGA